MNSNDPIWNFYFEGGVLSLYFNFFSSFIYCVRGKKMVMDIYIVISICGGFYVPTSRPSKYLSS